MNTAVLCPDCDTVAFCASCAMCPNPKGKSPPPAIPAECWATPRTGIDYLGAARVLCGGSSFQHTEKTA